MNNVIHTTKKYQVAKSESGLVYVKFSDMVSGVFQWVFIEDLKAVSSHRPQWQQKIIESVSKRFA